MLNANKSTYIDALDIYSFFRSKEDISNFLKYLFSEAITFSKLIMDNGNNKPFPVQYNSSQFVYQIDYQFTIYILGKWIADRTKDSSKLERVLRGYAITSHSLSSIQCKKNMKFLAIFFEEIIGIFKNHGASEKPTVERYRQFTKKIIECDGEYFEYKMLSFNRHQMKYFNSDWEKYMLDNDEYFYQNNTEQVAYGDKQCKTFWSNFKESNYKARLYFIIKDTDYLEGVNNILERNSNN